MKYLSWTGLQHFYDRYISPLKEVARTGRYDDLIEKPEIVNNTTTEKEGTILDGRVGKKLGTDISNIWKNLDQLNAKIGIESTIQFITVKQKVINLQNNDFLAIATIGELTNNKVGADELDRLYIQAQSADETANRAFIIATTMRPNGQVLVKLSEVGSGVMRVSFLCAVTGKAQAREETEDILIAEQEFERELFGNFDENIKLIEDTLSIDVILREGNIVLMGEEKNVDLAYKLMTELQDTVIKGKSLDKQSVTYSLSLLLEGSEMMIKELDDVIVVTKKGKAVQPKTLGQKKYIELINQNDITFGIGPAGTGKTYLAVAMAVSAFKKDEVNRIVLTRPAVEAGESLGFLPGDLKDKVDPYLRPLYDALFDMLGGERVNKFLERGTIEVAPLAFMRGRTLDNAFIILDEAQNTTPEQMKMFLTRLGFGSKAVVTGDITQTDLPDKKRSGLVQATTILENIKGIGKIELTEKDVVRHELVQRIIKAYDKFEKKEEFKKSKKEKEKTMKNSRR